MWQYEPEVEWLVMRSHSGKAGLCPQPQSQFDVTAPCSCCSYIKLQNDLFISHHKRHHHHTFPEICRYDFKNALKRSGWLNPQFLITAQLRVYDFKWWRIVFSPFQVIVICSFSRIFSKMSALIVLLPEQVMDKSFELWSQEGLRAHFISRHVTV